MSNFPEFTYLTPGEETGIKFDSTRGNSIAYGNGRWVAVGDSGKASYSDDGINWTVLTPGTDSGIRFGTTNAISIKYDNERWIVVGEGGKASYSNDGINWTTTNLNYDFMVPDDMGKGYCAMLSHMGAFIEINGVAYGNGRWIAVGNHGGGSYSDNNGESWTVIEPGCEDYGDAGTEGLKFGWEGDYYSPGNSVFNIAYGKDDEDNNLWVAVGEEGKASYSNDGLNWTVLTPGTDSGIRFGTSHDAYSVAYGNGRWVVVGQSGRASYSDDGVNWTVLTPGTDTGIKFGTTHARSVHYGNGYWVVVGEGGKASYSSDGETWTALTPGEETGIKFDTTIARCVAMSTNPKCIVVGDSGKASYSTMGEPSPGFNFKKLFGVSGDDIKKVSGVSAGDIKKIGGV